MTSIGYHFFLGIAAVWFMSGTLLAGGNGVKIKNLRVPEAVENGSKAAVILDCDYTLDDPADTEGLVVKWFFNNHPSPVYQWIMNEKPQDLGVLRGKLNLEYRASEDEAKKHRAMQIIQPTTELSGEYRCLVSTFTNEATLSKKMTIYVPGKGFHMAQEKQSDELATMKCSAEGVFPEPNMTIVAEDRRLNGRVNVETFEREGLYDIVATMPVEDKEVINPTSFECVLRIPEANFSIAKSTVYVPNSNAGHWAVPSSVLCTTTIALITSRL